MRTGTIIIFQSEYSMKSSSYCVMWYHSWGYRRNLNLITFGSERVNGETENGKGSVQSLCSSGEARPRGTDPVSLLWGTFRNTSNRFVQFLRTVLARLVITTMGQSDAEVDSVTLSCSQEPWIQLTPCSLTRNITAQIMKNLASRSLLR